MPRRVGGLEPAADARASSPDDVRIDRAAARRAAKEAKHEAKVRARSQRAEVRQKLLAEKARAKAAEQVDSESGDEDELEMEDPVDRTGDELAEQVPDEQPSPPVAVLADAATAENENEQRKADQAARTDERTANREATARARAAKQDAKDRARRERAEARSAARQAKAADRAARDDHIVEAPREPKPSFAQRLRGSRSMDVAPSADPTRPDGRTPGRGRRLVLVLAGIIGAIGLICSVILAIGALLVALDADGGRIYDVVSDACDVLVGPLRDVFSFSGSNADMKESLVAWGAGSIVYLVVGMTAQSLLRSTIDD
jgi:hypothetical protein